MKSGWFLNLKTLTTTTTTTYHHHQRITCFFRFDTTKPGQLTARIKGDTLVVSQGIGIKVSNYLQLVLHPVCACANRSLSREVTTRLWCVLLQSEQTARFPLRFFFCCGGSRPRGCSPGAKWTPFVRRLVSGVLVARSTRSYVPNKRG